MPATEPKKKSVSLKQAAIIALCLFVFDGLIAGAPAFGIMIALVVIAVSAVKSLIQLFKDKQQSKLYAIQVVIYIVAIAGIVGMFRFNSYIGQKRADMVINAVHDYHTAERKYPASLDQLVPKYLDRIPASSYRLFDRRYQYYFSTKDNPALKWTVVPPFGRRIYHFKDMKWLYIY